MKRSLGGKERRPRERALCLGTPTWYAGGSRATLRVRPQAPLLSLEHSLTLWILLEALGLALASGKPCVYFLS